MNYHATLTFPDPDGSLYAVLSQEETSRDRSSITLSQKNNELHIVLAAKDFSAFKGSLYGFLKLMDVNQKVGAL